MDEGQRRYLGSGINRMSKNKNAKIVRVGNNQYKAAPKQETA